MNLFIWGGIVVAGVVIYIYAKKHLEDDSLTFPAEWCDEFSEAATGPFNWEFEEGMLWDDDNAN